VSVSGELMVLQVEGETWKRGMSLQEFSDLAVQLGFEAAINLDGGGSVSMARAGSLLSEPSWVCGQDDDGDNLARAEGLFRCEKAVSSVTCMHASPPPFVSAFWMGDPYDPAPSPGPTHDPSSGPSPIPLGDTPGPSPTPSRPRHFRSSDPSPVPVSYWDPVPTSDDGMPSPSPSGPSDPFLNGTASSLELRRLREQLEVYRLASGGLLLLLALSLGAHCLLCARGRRTLPQAPEEGPYSKLGDPPLPGPGVEMVPYSQALPPEGHRAAGLFGFLGPPKEEGPSPGAEGWRGQLGSLQLEEQDFYDDDEEEDQATSKRALLRKIPRAPGPAPSPLRARARYPEEDEEEDTIELYGPHNPSRGLASRRPLLSGRGRDEDSQTEGDRDRAGKAKRGREKKKKGRRDPEEGDQ